MFHPCKCRLAPVLAISMALAATAWDPPADPKMVSDADLATWIDRRVEECQPKIEERRFDEIGWLKEIRTAEDLARKHNRPLFLFTHDGRMNLGRC